MKRKTLGVRLFALGLGAALTLAVPGEVMAQALDVQEQGDGVAETGWSFNEDEGELRLDSYRGAVTWSNEATDEIKKKVKKITVTESGGKTYLADFLFKGCDNVEKIHVIGSKGIEADSSAFYGMEKLKEVKFEGSMEVLPNSVFAGCKSLTKVEFPEGLLFIGGSAFEGTALKEVEIPKTVKYIQSGAFENCQDLEKVTFNGNVEVAENVFAKDKDIVFKVSGENTEELKEKIKKEGYKIEEENNKAPEAEDNVKPKEENNKVPEAEGSVKPEEENNKAPEAEGSAKPKEENNKAPEAEGSAKPKEENNKAPETEGSVTTKEENNKAPETEGSVKPKEENNKAPEAEESVTTKEENNKAPEAEGNVKPKEENNKAPEAEGNVKPKEENNKAPEAEGSVKPKEENNKAPEPGISIKPAVSGNIPAAVSHTGEQGVSAEVPMVPMIRYKTTSYAAGVASSVSGVYILNQGIKAAAITAAESIAESYNLAADAKPFAKITDMDEKKSHQAKKCLDETAAAYGAAAVGYINMEIGEMTKGKYTPLGENGSVIEIKLEMPDSALVKDASYAVVRVREGGKVDILKDMDTDLKTVTIETTAQAGAYAIIRY